MKNIIAILLAVASGSMLIWQFAPVHDRLEGIRKFCVYDKELVSEEIIAKRVSRKDAGDDIRSESVICEKHFERAKADIANAFAQAGVNAKGGETDWGNKLDMLEDAQQKIVLMPLPLKNEYMGEYERQNGIIVQAQERAEAKSKAGWIASLRERVYKMREYAGDGMCAENGWPPNAYMYQGGTFDENKQVAKIDGCVRRFPGSQSLQKEYCCPE